MNSKIHKLEIKNKCTKIFFFYFFRHSRSAFSKDTGGVTSAHEAQAPQAWEETLESQALRFKLRYIRQGGG